MINNDDRGEQSDGIFKALVDGLPDIVARYDRQARHLFISNNINQFDDLQPAQFIGKTHRELGFPEDTCQYMEDSVRSVFETGLPVETEYNIEYKQGLVTHNLRMIPELDAHGNVQSVLSITRDITAHRQAEKLYQSVFQQMVSSFALHEIICDEKGVPVDYRFIAVNPAFERMTGLSRKDVVGRTVKEVLPGIEPHWIEVYGKVALSGEPVSFEQYTAPLQRYFKVAAFQPAPNQFACLFTDITEHKQFDDIQTFLAQTSSGILDEPFFKSLARYLAKSLDMDFVCIDRLAGDGLNAHTVAVWCDGQFEDNVTYALKDTPCGEVVGKTVCCFPASVCSFFPRDQVLEHLKAECYVGVTLWNHRREPIGLIAVISRRPLLNRSLAEGTLRLVAVRAAGELERLDAEAALGGSEAKFRLAIVNAPIPIILHAEDGEVLQISQAWTEISGYTHEDIPTIDDWTERAYGIHKQSVRADIDTLYSLHGRKDEGEYVVTSADGRKLTWVFSSAGLGQLSDGRRIAVSMAMDITERKRAERALAEKDYFLIASQRVAKIGSYKLDFAAGIWESSEVLDMIFGIDAQYPRSVQGWLDIVFTDDREMMERYLHDTVIDQRQPFNTEYRIQRISDGAVEWVHGMGDVEFDLTGHPVSMFGTIQDITARKLAELEQTKLEDQLRQAMKMDSVGRLAGGVAHDFNNMLGVILGHAQMGMELVEPTQQLHDDLHEILTAAERSANLTRQLLTFARKQTIVPKVLNMNEAITGLLRMLERLIGENIKLNWRPSADLWLVKLDPTQVDQILANLCVNARDAITDVGQITIETDNIVIDDAFCTDHIEFKPGEYVQLSVSDSGCGMDKDTLSQIFEPFFTTKGLGEGTGLGLSTVFGAVKQNDGFINAYSEPGHGSRFTIYLPRHVDSDVQVSVNPVTAPAAHGYETILLVEDEPSILKMTKMMLERLGYTVITAAAPAEAIRLAEVYQGEIDMLLTDVVMPEMNGKDLAAKLLSLYPQLKRLFMSGYTADVIAQRDGLGNGVHFIQKPFSMRDLSAIVRKAMAGD